MPLLNENIFLTKDKMLWLILNDLETAKMLFHTNSFALFAVHLDTEVEYMITEEFELDDLFKTDISICIELIKFERLIYKLHDND